jgi:hypothetical protein
MVEERWSRPVCFELQQHRGGPVPCSPGFIPIGAPELAQYRQTSFSPSPFQNAHTSHKYFEVEECMPHLDTVLFPGGERPQEAFCLGDREKRFYNLYVLRPD